MLTYFPTPYPGEWWYSVLCRYHVRSGNIKNSVTIRELYGGKVAAQGKLFPGADCATVVARIPNAILDLRQILIEHTLMPYYLRFYPKERKEEILSLLLKGKNVAMTSKELCSPDGTEGLKFCTQCYDEDAYTLQIYNRLAYGNIIEDTFTKARLAVNDRLTSLCPKSIGKFVSVYENMDSENPEDWANAVHSCRRILLDLADALYPPQKDPIIIGKKEILVGHDQYINRLVQFISSKKGSQTYFNVVGSDLRSIGERLDAINDAVCKGTHVNVSKDEASRYIIHTYLLVSDIISLMD